MTDMQNTGIGYFVHQMDFLLFMVRWIIKSFKNGHCQQHLGLSKAPFLVLK